MGVASAVGKSLRATITGLMHQQMRATCSGAQYPVATVVYDRFRGKTN